jgi:hypothetical protein
MRARTAAEREGAAENLVDCAVNAASRFARFLHRESLFRLTGRSLVGKLGLTEKCSCTIRCRVTPERKARAFLFSGGCSAPTCRGGLEPAGAPSLPSGRMGHPRSHSWRGTEPAAGEGSLPCVISSVARKSQRDSSARQTPSGLGMTNSLLRRTISLPKPKAPPSQGEDGAPRRDAGGTSLGHPRSRYTPLALPEVVLCVCVSLWPIP